MHVHMNELFNAHYIIQKRMENNNDLCWIAKVHVEKKSDRLENVLTCHKFIE